MYTTKKITNGWYNNNCQSILQSFEIKAEIRFEKSNYKHYYTALKKLKWYWRIHTCTKKPLN